MRGAGFLPVLAFVAASTAPAAVPFLDDFESETLGDINGQNGWARSSYVPQAGTFDAENTTVLAGSQSLGLNGVAAQVTEYRHFLDPSYYAVYSWTMRSTAALGAATPGLYVCYTSDTTEAWGVWMNAAGGILVDDIGGYWNPAGSVAAGVDHMFTVKQYATGTFEVYVDGGASPIYTGTVMSTTWVDRVLVGCWDTAATVADQVVFDSFSYSVPPPAIAAAQSAAWGNKIGDPVHFEITVTNTGLSIIDTLTIVDTVPIGVIGVTTSPGAGWALTSVAGVGTRYEWTGSALALNPGAALTFTIDGTIGVVCAQTPMSNTMYVTAWDTAASVDVLSGGGGTVVEPYVQGVTITETQTPAGPYAFGGPLTYDFVVTNTGTATLTNLVVTDTVSPSITGTVPTTPAGFTLDPVVETASGTLYSWTSTGPFLPGATATFSIAGTIGAVCSLTLIQNTAYLSGAYPCTATEMASNTVGASVPPVCGVASVETAIAVSPEFPSLCQDLIVDVTVTNTGGGALTNFGLAGDIPRLEGPGRWVSGPTPAFSLSMSGGESATYRFVYSSSGTGTIVLSVTATGTDIGSGSPIADWLASSPAVPIPAGSGFDPDVVATVTSDQPRYVSGSSIEYSIMLRNQGGDPATNVRVWDTVPLGVSFESCGGAPCGLVSGTLVVWTLTGTMPSGSDYEVRLRVRAPGTGTCPPLVPTDPCAVGGCVRVGWSNLCGVAPWWSGWALYASTPEVLNPVLVPVVTPVPASVAEGGPVKFEILVTNTCTDTAVNIRVWDTVPAGMSFAGVSLGGTHTAGLITWVPMTLGPSSATLISFTVSATSPGPTLGPAIATVSYSNSTAFVQPYAVSAAATVAVLNPSLSVVKTGPDTGTTGDFLTFLVSLANNGTDTAYSLVVTDNMPPELSFVTGSATAVVAGKSVSWAMPPLPPGGRTSITATMRGPGTDDELTLVNRATADCRNAKGLAMPPVTGTKTFSLTPVLKSRVFPVPFNPATAVGGTLKFSGLPASARVHIYTVSGALVRELVDVRRHRLEWDGRTDSGAAAAPGLYLYTIDLPGGKQLRGNFGLVR